jgi:hypothetical protein
MLGFLISIRRRQRKEIFTGREVFDARVMMID